MLIGSFNVCGLGSGLKKNKVKDHIRSNYKVNNLRGGELGFMKLSCYFYK